MRTLKKFTVLAAVVFAFSAITAASASAFEFTSTATGNYTATANSPQEFNDNGNGGGALNKVTCNQATANGVINALAFTEISSTTNFSSCSAFLGISATVSEAVTTTTGSSVDHSKKPITVNVGGMCTVVVAEQTFKRYSFANSGGKLLETWSAESIVSTGSGGVCGSAHNSGSINGGMTFSSSGSLSVDP